MSRDALEAAYLGAVAAADPTRRVKAFIRTGALDDWFGDREDPDWINVIAIGKAAPRMLWGLVEASVPFRGIGVAPHGARLTQVDTFRWLRGDHPVPGDASYEAGHAVRSWLMDRPPGPVLVLLSGGASSLCEVPLDPASHGADWQALLDAGRDIVSMNEARAALSAIKGGRLGAEAIEHGHRLHVAVLSDVPAGHERRVGSGLFDHPDIPHTVVGDRSLAIEGAGQTLQSLGLTPYRHPDDIAGDVASEVAAFLEAAARLPEGSVLVGAGEATVKVPADAPAGGRCQHAALLAARILQGGTGRFLAAGTDGIDGATRDAGATVDGTSWDDAAQAALDGFAAAEWLDARGFTISPGQTGTNVNDIWLAAR